MPAGESLEFIANVTTNEVEESNYFDMWLQNEAGVRIVSAVDDGNEGPQSNGNPNDDNLSLSLLYKQYFASETTLYLYAKAVGVPAHYVPQHQLQIGYKTYGSGHEMTVGSF